APPGLPRFATACRDRSASTPSAIDRGGWNGTGWPRWPGTTVASRCRGAGCRGGARRGRLPPGPRLQRPPGRGACRRPAGRQGRSAGRPGRRRRCGRQLWPGRRAQPGEACHGLVSWDRSSLAKASDACEDLIGRLDPDEGLGLLVVNLEVKANCVFQLARAAMRPTPDLLLGQGCEPALDLIEPGAIGRCVVDLEAGVTQQ